jgi:hypothetical protein
MYNQEMSDYWVTSDMKPRPDKMTNNDIGKRTIALGENIDSEIVYIISDTSNDGS